MFLDGYKTYIAGFLAILSAVVHVAVTQSIDATAELLFTLGLGMIGLRNAMPSK